MEKRIVGIALGAMLFAYCAAAQAQQARKFPLIGYLGGSSFSIAKPNIEAFRQGLRELGYIEGKNILLEYRWADAKFDGLTIPPNVLARADKVIR